MHPEALPPKTRECLALLARQSWLKGFYLAGGTGLAIHLGHRISEDLDFFSNSEVDPKKIRSLLQALGNLRVEMERENTLWAILQETKISFFRYDYPLLEKPLSYQEMALADIKDIACMKLDTISSRGSRKDFVDLYWILQQGHSLQDVFAWFDQKYRGVDYNKAHLLKSLTYFEDAENDTDLKMLKPCPWQEVKQGFKNAVKQMVG